MLKFEPDFSFFRLKDVYKRGLVLVIALDPPFGPKGEYTEDFIVKETCNTTSGYKIGLPLILKCGLRVIDEVKSICKSKVIVDLKLADIGDIHVYVVEKLAKYEADAVIAHGFVGIRDSIDKLTYTANKHGIEIILVTSMSHKGSEEFIDKHFEELVNIALDLKVHGIIVPATKPDMIRRARSIVGTSMRIYSPGIGVQGAEVGSALCAGADYEIIGRYITRSLEPGKVAKEAVNKQMESLKRCRDHFRGLNGNKGDVTSRFNT